MEHHSRPIGRPKTPYALFVKLYCKKWGSCNKKLTKSLLSAANAWVTLNEEEKNMFIDKFNKCKEKHKNQIADCLEKMKPYMKKKQIKRSPSIDKSESVINDEVADGESHTDVQDDDNVFKNKSHITLSERSSIQDHLPDSKMENYEEEEAEVPVLSNPEEQALVEPSPPSVRNSIDLFNIIKQKNRDSNIEWASLTKEEKLRYRKAVYELKTDYIQNYKRYLESLPSIELFKYYHKIVDKNLINK